MWPDGVVQQDIRNRQIYRQLRFPAHVQNGTVRTNWCTHPDLAFFFFFSVSGKRQTKGGGLLHPAELTGPPSAFKQSSVLRNVTNPYLGTGLPSGLHPLSKIAVDTTSPYWRLNSACHMQHKGVIMLVTHWWHYKYGWCRWCHPCTPPPVMTCYTLWVTLGTGGLEGSDDFFW